MKPLIHLDMDSVISDFMFEYTKIAMPDSKEKFKHAVLEHRIFEKLPYMPNACNLINLLFQEMNADVVILSSLGTWDETVAAAGKTQKEKWLDERGIECPRIFVNSWAVKHVYARPYSIMIDDRADVIENYKASGGHGILYAAEDFENIKHEIVNTYNSLKG